MPVTQIEVERVCLTSDKPFDLVVAKVKDGIRRPYMPSLWHEIWGADSFAEIEAMISDVVGSTGLMQFEEFDNGRFIRKDKGESAPNATRLLIGNPLIMKQMTECVPDAAGYAPTTILIDERGGKVYLAYDRMESLLSAYRNATASRLARDLDTKIERLMASAI